MVPSRLFFSYMQVLRVTLLKPHFDNFVIPPYHITLCPLLTTLSVW